MKDYLLGLYEKSMPHRLTLRQKLEYTKAAGFDYLEVSIDETDEKLSRLWWSKEDRREVVNAVCDTGVQIGSMCLSGHRKYPLGSLTEQVRNTSLEIMARAIDLACDWGIHTIQLAGYDVYYEQGNEKTEELFRQNLSASVDMAAKAGVMLAFETMETPFMDTVEKAMRYVSDINSPYLQVYPDLGNMVNAALIYGHDAVNDMLTGCGHIAAVHLKETLPGKYREVPYGTGHVDFASGIKAALRLGVRRFVGEFWDNGDYEAQIIHANTLLRGILDRC
jgi:predicted hexulose-6-phosphate isomerase